MAADCHGPYALIECKKADGSPLVAGLEVTGFTNAEEAAAGATEWVTSNAKLMQTAFEEQGAKFNAGPDWASNVCAAGNLITAQNPGSAVACAEARPWPRSAVYSSKSISLKKNKFLVSFLVPIHITQTKF